MKATTLFITLACLCFAPCFLAANESEIDMVAFDQCLLERIKAAGPEDSVAEIREACLLEVQGVAEAPVATTPPTDTPEEISPLTERIEGIKATQELDYVITPYKPNYLMVGYNPNPNNAPFQEAFPDEEIDFKPAEVKFQISFMFPVAHNIFGDDGSVYVAYTNRSFWQVFDSELSSPFRETNHEPEIWLQLSRTRKVLGLTNRLTAFGFNHQSNGRNEPISRSWNRLFARFIFEKGRFVFSVKPWIIVGSRDGNPDIRDFMGNIEVRGAYKSNRHTISLMLRNNLQSGFSRGTFEVDWSFPIYRRVRGYAQYFNGYGESLIDYDVHTNTLGVGLSFTDYF
ncbi:MAG: phospholipase A [Candidatus Sulfomarinibacteraceae bacterium]